MERHHYEKVGLKKLNGDHRGKRNRNKDTYFIVNEGHEGQQRSTCQDDQCNFPALAKAENEGAEERRVSLNNYRKFFANTFLDFKNISATKKAEINSEESI